MKTKLAHVVLAVVLLAAVGVAVAERPTWAAIGDDRAAAVIVGTPPTVPVPVPYYSKCCTRGTLNACHNVIRQCARTPDCRTSGYTMNSTCGDAACMSSSDSQAMCSQPPQTPDTYRVGVCVYTGAIDQDSLTTCGPQDGMGAIGWCAYSYADNPASVVFQNQCNAGTTPCANQGVVCER